MKKLLVSFAILFLLTGCSFSDLMNTPTKRVEEFLGKYQIMDSTVLQQLSDVVSRTDSLDESQKKEYRDLMKKQYQNLMYKIKDETVDGDQATVEVEIEVFNYGKQIEDAQNYLEEHEQEFVTDGNVDYQKFMDYKIDKMQNTTEKIQYTILFSVHKEDGVWILDDIGDDARRKIHGLYIG